MYLKSILYFLLLGTSALCGVSASRQTNETLQPQTRESDIDSFIPINPKQVRQAEKAINIFLTKLAGPISGRIVLRSTSKRENNLEQAIEQICQIIRKKCMEFAAAFGLTKTVEQYKRSLSSSKNDDDWFSQILLQSTLLFTDMGRAAHETWSHVDNYLRKYNINLHNKKAFHPEDGLQYLGSINDFTRTTVSVSKCLKTNGKNKGRNNFNLEVNLARLMRGLPGNTLRTFRSRLDKAFSAGSSAGDAVYNQLHPFLCRFAINSRKQYQDCVKQVKRVHTCVHEKDRHSNHNVTKDQPSTRSWFKAIQYLHNCTVKQSQNGDSIVICSQMNETTPSNVNHRTTFIYETILNRSIKNGSPLKRAMNDLGQVFSGSNWGRRFIDEIYQYAFIYKEGLKRTEILSKTAKKDPVARRKYKKMLRSLKLYKRGLLSNTLDTIRGVHRSASEFEKILVEGIRSTFNQAWQSHLEILKTMVEWMNKLFDLYIYGVLDQENGDDASSYQESSLEEYSSEMIEWGESNGSEEISNGYKNGNKHLTRTKGETKRDLERRVDVTFNRFMRSINQIRLPNSNVGNTLGCIANNLLLVTMFMETVGLVATLFCVHNSQYDSTTSVDIVNVARKRREVKFSTFQQFEDKLDLFVGQNTSSILDDYRY